jgi:hypothetical protein
MDGGAVHQPFPGGDEDQRQGSTLDAVLAAVHGLAGRTWQHLPSALIFPEGNRLLREHTETLLGPSPANRAVRNMVTMPSEAASDYQLVRATSGAWTWFARLTRRAAAAHTASASFRTIRG